MHEDWGVSGRAEELERLTSLLAGGGTGALVVGEEGVGKSRLLHEVRDRLDEAGVAAITITATPGSALLPLGSLAPLLPAGSTSTGLPVLPVLRQSISARAGDRRPVLVVDDVQHLDDASAVLVNQLVTNGDVGLVASQTAGTIAPEPVARLWQDGVVDRIELAPLDRDQVADLCESIAGSPLDALTLELVWNTTGGNALFVREVLMAARESGNLVIENGVAQIRSVPATAPRLVDFVRHRIGDLDDAASEALLMVAVGEPLGPGEFPARVTSELLARLDASGLIVTSQDWRRVVIRLVHPLFGEVLRAGASPLQLQQVHRELAAAVRARGARRRLDHLRLAHWSVAGQVPVERELLLHAARTARFGQDMDLARDLAESAWRAHHDFETGELLADIYYELGDTVATAELRPAWEATATTDDERIRIEINTAITEFWKRGDEPASSAALDRAEALGRSEWREEATAVRSLLLAAQCRSVEAVALAEPFIDRPPDRVLIQAAMALTHAYRSLGRADDAVAVCDRALDAYGELGEQIALITTRVLGVGRTVALAESGRLADAEEEASRTIQLCRTEGEIGGIGLAALVHGWVQFMQGRLRSAQRALRLAESSFVQTGHVGMRQWAHIALALACATTGDAAAARTWLERIDEVGRHPADLFGGALARARAWTAMAEGDPEGARSLLERGIEERAALDDVQGVLGCLYDLARLGGAAACEERMRATAARCQGLLPPVMATHVTGMATGQADLLGRAADGLAELGALLWAAEAAYAAADASRKAGDPRMAAHWSRVATDWRGACETAMTPGLVADLAPVPLTRREREVAILAAAGLPAREIGERLYVSRRTVESHLARIYGKLGISSRSELAALLNDPPE
jgi:ATP/maltotriose-dependent transcriptional regulator MalT